MLTLDTFHTTDPTTAYNLALAEMYNLQLKVYEKYYNSQLELRHNLYQQEGAIAKLNVKIDAQKAIIEKKNSVIETLKSVIQTQKNTIDTQQTVIQKIYASK